MLPVLFYHFVCCRPFFACLSMVAHVPTERYFQWDKDGGDNYLAYKASGRSEKSEEFALLGPFWKDFPRNDAQVAADVEALVRVQFANALRHCDTPAFLQVCRDSLAVLFYHKAWLAAHCPFLVTQPFMEPANARLGEWVFVGFEDDPMCPVGRLARGVPEHLRSRMETDKLVSGTSA